MMGAQKPKRQKAVSRMNLSDHTLDINIRRCNYSLFRFSEIEEYVRGLTGSRDYQFDAIKQVMIYLWGGGYKSVSELARESFGKKGQIQHRFGTEEHFLYHLPLPDRLSGVVHMATGTGKSYVIFAIAYLSLVMDLTKRVLVLGPASTIIEQGLREKFRALMDNRSLNSKLPQKYRGKVVQLLTDNDPIEDKSIVIENINAVYTFGGITDTLFKNTEEVLVLGDEHRQAIDWLNEHTDEEINFFVVKMELWQIDNSTYAPKFQIVCKPNEWAKMIKVAGGKSGLTDTKVTQLDFWNKFREYAQAKKTQLRLRKAYPQHWYDISMGTSGGYVALTINTQAKVLGCEFYIPDSKDLFCKLAV